MQTSKAEIRTPTGSRSQSVRNPAGHPEGIKPEGKRSWWVAPVRWLRRKISGAVTWLTAQIKSPFRLAKSIFMATVGRDRGFGFWWLIATVAIALAVGLLIAVLLSPVIGLFAALIVGIWMLVRHSRSANSPATGSGSHETGSPTVSVR